MRVAGTIIKILLSIFIENFISKPLFAKYPFKPLHTEIHLATTTHLTYRVFRGTNHVNGSRVN